MIEIGENLKDVLGTGAICLMVVGIFWAMCKA